jgi:hypothetical protein
MTNGEFTTAITKITADCSHFEPSRNYISLSHISLSVDELIEQYRNGFEDNLNVRLKCYKGYQMEADLLKRITLAFGARISTGIEITLHNGLVKGHPDFTFDRYPGDCKSVLMDDWLPQGKNLSRKIYWQMQAYMRFTGQDKAIVIYESRESGKIEDYWLRANISVQKEIDEKIKAILNILNLK